MTLLVEALGRHLADEALRGAQHVDPLDDQLLGRQRLVAGAVQADEFGDVLEVLAEDELFALGDDRHVAHAECQQVFAAARVVQHVDGDEVDVFFRKKLFRSEAAASPGLGEEHELVGDGMFMGALIRGWRSLLVRLAAYLMRRSRVKHGARRGSNRGML